MLPHLIPAVTHLWFRDDLLAAMWGSTPVWLIGWVQVTDGTTLAWAWFDQDGNGPAVAIPLRELDS